jgi:tripeptide aminopeptidase
MNNSYIFTAAERFMRYVQIDTQSNPHSNTHPTTEKQKDLSKLLAAELQAMGIANAHTDEFGYVYASIPANTGKKVPVICFCSHVDTAPDCSGTNVKPILHKNYSGAPIVLPDDETQVITTDNHPYLLKCIGKDIITASGNTLLGADDKSGVAIIMDVANYLVNNKDVPHGEVKILFTPDEEVGQGTAKVDLKKLGADFGYTLDSGDAGAFEDETFSADAVKITIEGIITHPGTAKNKMVNAIKIAGEILANLPKHTSPETTEGKEGFIHPTFVTGLAEKASIEFIIRDFVTAELKTKEDMLRNIAEGVLAKYPGASMEFTITEQYRNMKEILDQHPQVVDYAKQAIAKAGLSLQMESIRGGTDGSRLSFMGLPCPNIFTGMQGIHSKQEYICVQDMHKSVETLLNLLSIWEQNA